jgi:hypothetical protein
MTALTSSTERMTRTGSCVVPPSINGEKQISHPMVMNRPISDLTDVSCLNRRMLSLTCEANVPARTVGMDNAPGGMLTWPWWSDTELLSYER